MFKRFERSQASEIYINLALLKSIRDYPAVTDSNGWTCAQSLISFVDNGYPNNGIVVIGTAQNLAKEINDTLKEGMRHD